MPANRRSHRRSAFTLIELMVVVAIIGVLAAIAVPSFIGYLRRSRTSEAVEMLSTLYGSAAALYVAERAGRGVTSSVVTACIAEPTNMSPSTPSGDKQSFTGGAGFDELSFKLADYVYFGYGISSIGNPGGITCFRNAGYIESVYTFYAHGDLDADGTRSTFELPVGASDASQLRHSRGLHIVNDTE